MSRPENSAIVEAIAKRRWGHQTPIQLAGTVAAAFAHGAGQHLIESDGMPENIWENIVEEAVTGNPRLTAVAPELHQLINFLDAKQKRETGEGLDPVEKLAVARRLKDADADQLLVEGEKVGYVGKPTPTPKPGTEPTEKQKWRAVSREQMDAEIERCTGRKPHQLSPSERAAYAAEIGKRDDVAVSAEGKTLRSGPIVSRDLADTAAAIKAGVKDLADFPVETRMALARAGLI